MLIMLRINLSQPLVFGILAPINYHGDNWIAFWLLELPRLLCNYCNRLGHTPEDCIDFFLLNHPRMQSPDQYQIVPHEIMPIPEDNLQKKTVTMWKLMDQTQIVVTGV